MQFARIPKAVLSANNPNIKNINHFYGTSETLAPVGGKPIIIEFFSRNDKKTYFSIVYIPCEFHL